MSNYKIPMRMCVACRQMYPKQDMIRIARTKQSETSVYSTGKAQGRGAYVCRNKTCIDKCVKSKLINKAFRTNISSDIYTTLQENNDK